MLPNGRAQPAARDKYNLVERVQQAVTRASWPRKIVIVVLAVLFGCLVLAPVALAKKDRTRLASAYVAMFAIWLIDLIYIQTSSPPWSVRWALIALPVAVAIIANLG